MSAGPALVLGLPLYGRGEHLEEALESLLGQTRGDLAVIVTDDSSDPDARRVLDSFHDPRLHYYANDKRLGLVGNWRRSFELARREFPAARYFAWASDHDAWHPFWAERLLALLEQDPGAVMAFPKTYRMDSGGSTLRGKDWSFDTTGSANPAARLRATMAGMSAGNMVYGIYRVTALERAGVFRYSLLPDRLLLTELSIQGDLRQVPEALFYRRVTEAPSSERQRAAFWPDGPPRWAKTPWPYQHAVIMAATLARGGGPAGLGARERGWLIANHLAATAVQGARSGFGSLYYKRIMRRRSLKYMAAKAVGRMVEWLQVRAWGVALLDVARRGARASASLTSRR